MWIAFIRDGGLAVAVLAFLMRVLRWVLDPIIAAATAGPHASHSSVQTIAGWFAMLSVENLTLIAGLGVALFLLGRATTERRVGV
jgi:hypothetical protein